MGTPAEPGYRLKLRRAYEHLDSIDRAVRAFIESDVEPAVGFDPQPENEWTILKRGGTPEIDPMIGVYLGDFIHNARSALDNLVCAMVRRENPDGDIKHAWFPAFDGYKKWVAEIIDRDREINGPAPTDGVAPKVLAAIEASQPYKIKSPAARRRAPMLLLQAASNSDKHQTIHAVRARVAPRTEFKGEMAILPTGYFAIRAKRFAAPGTPLETGAEIGRLKVRILNTPPPNVEVGVHVRSAVEIVFGIEGKPDVSHLEVWPMLTEAWKAVLRVERAVGIGGLPPPNPAWSWTPE